MQQSIKEIHTHLQKKHPQIIKKVRHHFKYKYPKLTTFCIVVIAAYVFFSNPMVAEYLSHLDTISYLGVFIAGVLFSYGFTTPFAVGLFITIEPSSIYLAALIGGAGAYLADFTIFSIIKNTFMDEFNQIEKTNPMRKLKKIIKSNVSKRIQFYLLYVAAGLILASPLPDELGVALLAGIGHIKPGVFSIISFLCNTAGILVILLL